jgi:hypothetical protein
MDKGAEFPVSGRGMWVSGIGYMLAWGTTVPGNGGTGYGVGCDFWHTDGSGSADLHYRNVGSRSSCEFRPVLIADVSGSAAGAGPSPLIWDSSLWAAVQNDPTLGFGYFNDYLGEIDVTTADGYVITQVTSGGIAGVTDEDGGVLLVDSQGNASADDGVNVQLTNCMFKPAAGRTIRFEARVKFNDNSALTSQFAIGLAGVDTTLIAAGVLDDVVDKALWFHHGATTADKMSVCAARTSAEDIDADKATTVDDTYIKLGFVINGITSIQWYADGVLVHTSSVAANIPNAVMCLSYVAQTEGAAKDAEMSVDWVRILQEGART